MVASLRPLFFKNPGELNSVFGVLPQPAWQPPGSTQMQRHLLAPNPRRRPWWKRTGRTGDPIDLARGLAAPARGQLGRRYADQVAEAGTDARS